MPSRVPPSNEAALLAPATRSLHPAPANGVRADAIRLLTLTKTLWSDGDALLALTCDVLVAVEYNDVTIRRDVKVRPTHPLASMRSPWARIRLALIVLTIVVWLFVPGW